MATVSELLALAERAERATGPSDALDFDIATATQLRGTGLSPSRSLDAALALVPEGLRWGMGLRGDGRCFAAVGRIDGKVYASTPALALCSAALRARARAQETPR